MKTKQNKQKEKKTMDHDICWFLLTYVANCWKRGFGKLSVLPCPFKFKFEMIILEQMENLLSLR